jgi:hypothetical protein
VSLRGYFALVESGATTLARSELAKRVPPETHVALRAAGLVRSGRPATAWPCDQSGRRCGREVLESAAGSAKPFVAVCDASCGDEDPCVAVDLTAEDLAQETIALADLARVVQRLFQLEGDLLTASLLAHANVKPIVLGTEPQAAGARDVFFAARPGDAAFPLFLETRERASRPTLVLIPTGRRLAPETATRHARGAHVEVEVLEDVIAFRSGEPARVAKLRVVGSPASTSPTIPAEATAVAAAPPIRSTTIAAEVGASSWAELRITAIDGHTLRIQCGEQSIRRTFVELGFAGELRDPIVKWKIVLAVCAGHGSFRWKRFGTYKTAKNGVSVVRRLLKKAFGLEDDPFHKFNVAEGWRTKFFASTQIEEG